MASASSKADTSLVTFWSGFADPNITLSLKQFTVAAVDESKIAIWLGIPSKVTKKVVHYEDGQVSESTRPMAIPGELTSAYWDVEADTSNPYHLSASLVTTFPVASIIETYLRAGQISTWDLRTHVAHLLFRLAGPGYVQPIRDIRFDQNGRQRGGSVASDMRLTTPLPKWIQWEFSRDTEIALKRLANCYWDTLNDGTDTYPNDCFVALEHFTKAISKARVDQEIYLWIALEAMFSPSDQGELSNRIAQFTSLFTADRPQRFDRYRFLKKRYTTRSQFVHGTDKPSEIDYKKSFEDSYAEYLKLEDIVRLALRRYLRCRMVQQISREDLHQVFNRACLDDSALGSLPIDPAHDQSLG
jgi:hypothetical protein